jgi:predicted O-methyltransferase YrrM
MAARNGILDDPDPRFQAANGDRDPMRRLLRNARRRLRFALSGVLGAYPNGHFYSPVCDPKALNAARAELWPDSPRAVAGIDFNDASHREILDEWFPRHLGAFDYAEDGPQDAQAPRYYTGNTQFSWLDARLLFVLLCELKPKRVIEVGSGYSSLLMADVNQRFLGGACDIRCVEPYPRPFLENGVPGIRALIRERVQALPLSTFATLEAGDILFIDSSHVSKTGSDVNHLFFEVLPALKPGVLIHVHDVFLPAEYLEPWAIAENRSWNEQYLLRALLMYSTAFTPVFGSSYAWIHHRPSLLKAIGRSEKDGYGGGSFWMRRV